MFGNNFNNGFGNNGVSRSYNPTTNSVQIRNGFSNMTISADMKECATCSCWSGGICSNTLSPMFNKSTNAMSMCCMHSSL